MTKILVLSSGNGGNLKFLHQSRELVDVEFFVVADRNCGAVEYASKVGIQNAVIGYSREDAAELRSQLNRIRPDVIITNWHKIIDEVTVREYANRMVNLHYSLLPAFGGLIGVAPVRKAFEQGCRFIGPTCHLVDEGVDTGRILAQAVFTTDRTIEEAIEMMFRAGCLVLLNGLRIVLNYQQGLKTSTGSINEVMFHPQTEKQDLYFDDRFWDRVACA